MSLPSVVTASLLFLTASSVAGAQESTGPAAPLTTVDGSHGSGITVHGAWTITVRDSNGVPASVHRFENALDGGGAVLAQLLAHPDASVKDWAVSLNILGSNGTSRCIDPTTRAPTTCIIAGPVFSIDPQGGGVRGLVAAVTGNTLALKGAIRAMEGGTIIEVATGVQCAAVCSSGRFTFRNMAESHAGEPAPVAIVIKPGQWIDVTVVLSFS